MPNPYGHGQPSPLGVPTRSGIELVPAPGLPPVFPWYLKPIPFNMRDVEAELLAYLTQQNVHRFDAAHPPKLARWLYSTWTAEGNAIKDQEIRNALRDGQMSEAWLARWQEDYSVFINTQVDPEWRAAMARGATIGLDGIAFSPDMTSAAIRDWLDTRAGEMIVNLTEAQAQAVRNVLRHFIAERQGVESAAAVGRYLRPIIGLTPREEMAVRKYRTTLLDGGNDLARTEHLVGNYSSWLRRRRGFRIARTEIAYAFNYGQFEGVRQAVASGILGGDVYKIWSTARDEKVCPTCGALDSKLIGLEATFPVVRQTQFVPPAHPNCRCTIKYVVGVPPDHPFGTVADGSVA